MSNKNRIRKRLHELKDEDMPEDQWVDYMDDVASALGWFIVSFNDLDFEITATICELAALGTKQNTDVTFTLISTKHFAQKVKDLEMLFSLIVKNKKNEPELRKKFDMLIADINHLNKERNALVHANWYITEQEGNDTLVNSKTSIDKVGFYHEYFKCSPDYIEELEDKCDSIGKEVEKLVEELKKP